MLSDNPDNRLGLLRRRKAVVFKNLVPLGFNSLADLVGRFRSRKVTNTEGHATFVLSRSTSHLAQGK